MSRPTQHSPGKLTDEHTLNCITKVMEKHIPISANGYCCKTTDLWHTMFNAAAHKTTIESVCQNTVKGPSANTIRGYLKEQLRPEMIPTLERQCNLALREQVPDFVFDKPRELAFDLHDESYYGQSDPDDPHNWVCRGQARKGTTRFYRCATAYVILRQVRVTLAIVFIRPGLPVEEIVERLIQLVHETGIRIHRLYLDKGFFSVATIHCLQRHALSAILAAPLTTGKRGLRALCKGRGSYRTSHTFHNPTHGSATVDVVLARTYAHVRSKRRHARWCAFVCIDIDDEPQQITGFYRRRFGIESSYRLMERVRVRTTSLNPALRFLFMALALVLLNVRIFLQWEFLRIAKQGPRRVASHLFRLDRMIQFLSQALIQLYGSVTAVEVPMN